MHRGQPTYVNMPPKRRPVRLHAGWLEHKSSLDSKWKRFWCSLRGNIIYIFKDQTASHEQHIGTLTVDSTSRFEIKKDGDPKTGYRFDLHTGRRANKFRTSKFSDREHWRAFVEGLSKGSVPDNIDLPETLIDDVRRAIINPYTDEAPEPPRNVGQRRRASLDTINTSQEGFDQPESFRSGNNGKFNTLHFEYLQPSPVRPPIPNQTAPPPPSNNNMDPVFYSDLSRKDIPNWFFKDCSRELAMEVLCKAAGKNMGNTLMRSRPDSSYQNLVISKMMENGMSNNFTHYEVRSVKGGYIIVLDETHAPMDSLDDIMDFFKSRSGSATTRVMTCNDLKIILDPQNDYQTSIEQVEYADEGQFDNIDYLLKDIDHLPPFMDTSPPQSSKGGSSEGSFGSFSTVSSCSQKSSSCPQPPAAPPAPPAPPPLPPNHPPPLRKSESNVDRLISNSSQNSKNSSQPPPIRPKPKKASSFDEGLKPAADNQEFSRRLGADDCCAVVYAEIKKSTSFESSLNCSFEYTNCKTKCEEKHLLLNKSQSQDDLMTGTYIMMNHSQASPYRDDIEEAGYEPVETLHYLKVDCSKELPQAEKNGLADMDCYDQLNGEDMTIATGILKPPEFHGSSELFPPYKINYDNAEDDLDCDIFQEINFHQNQNDFLEGNLDSSNEEYDYSGEAGYESFSDKNVYGASGISHTKSLDYVIMKRGNHGTKTGGEQDDNSYETIHIPTARHIPRRLRTPDISTPDEISKGIDCKAELSQRPRAPSPFQKDQNTISNYKLHVLQQSQSNPSFKSSQLEDIYEEVQQLFSEDPSIDNSAYYIDLIASYEDIKAVQLRNNKSFHSSQNKNKEKALLKHRSKSETSFSALNANNSVLSGVSDFMKELQSVLKGQGPLKSIANQNHASAQQLSSIANQNQAPTRQLSTRTAEYVLPDTFDNIPNM